jgi:hypothetical protein
MGINRCSFNVELPGLDSNQDKESQNLLEISFASHGFPPFLLHLPAISRLAFHGD